MTLSLRAGFALLATTAVLAGCSTSPTITVPNPLAALNGVFTPAPRVAAPTYTSVPGNYQQVAPASYGAVVPSYTSVPSYDTASYGAVGQGYSVPSVDTGSYSMGRTGVAAPSYSAASSFDQGTYTLGSGIESASAPSYSTGVPMLGTLASSAPSYSMAAPATESYSMAAPMMESSSSYSMGSTAMSAAPSYSMASPVMEQASYVSEVAGYSEPMTASPSYSEAYGTQSYGMSQPVRASGTTYDLTAPSTMGTMDPAAGLTIESGGYGGLSSAAPSMGGSFQVTTPAMDSGVATYSAPSTIGGYTY